MKKIMLCWALLSVFFCSTAQADIRFERFLPVNPTSDYPVQVELWFSGFAGVWCDLVHYVPGTNTSIPDSVTVSGNAIRMQVPVDRLGDCSTSSGFDPRLWLYPLPRLPAGNYTLEIVAKDRFSAAQPLIQVATVPLVVAAGSLVEVPAATMLGITLLTLAILVIGMLNARVER